MRVCPVSEVSSSAASTSRTFESANAVPFADAFGRCFDPAAAAAGAAVPFGGNLVGAASARAGVLMPAIACAGVRPDAGLAAGEGCIATLGARAAGTTIGGGVFATGVGATCVGAAFATGTSACTLAALAGPLVCRAGFWGSRAGASALRATGGVSIGGAAAREGAGGTAACTVGTDMAGGSKFMGAATGARAGFISTGRATGVATGTGAGAERTGAGGVGRGVGATCAAGAAAGGKLGSAERV